MIYLSIYQLGGSLMNYIQSFIDFSVYLFS